MLVLAAPVLRSGLRFFTFKSVSLVLCIHAAPFAKYTLSQPHGLPPPQPGHPICRRVFPSASARGLAERALPRLSPARTGWQPQTPGAVWVRRQQAWCEPAGEVRELGADVKGPRGVGTAASRPPGEPTRGPPRLLSAPMLSAYSDSPQIVTCGTPSLRSCPAQRPRTIVKQRRSGQVGSQAPSRPSGQP